MFKGNQKKYKNNKKQQISVNDFIIQLLDKQQQIYGDEKCHKKNQTKKTKNKTKLFTKRASERAKEKE